MQMIMFSYPCRFLIFWEIPKVQKPRNPQVSQLASLGYTPTLPYLQYTSNSKKVDTSIRVQTHGLRHGYIPIITTLSVVFLFPALGSSLTSRPSGIPIKPSSSHSSYVVLC
ncbi:Protein of unknown function [Pyronema omphalodes CBS 100304]|uniref:Uncharacterized protein n=1 Tax=Pyronema omphalodes (strain CBS 100304) TaxID=1076935 RepID=U4LCX0_PYROM|nr:Protein of unknown function [Pyronema omphalodes CBS 100304]